jgi:hypothetical protein
MLKHPTLDLLGQLGLVGMAKALILMESNDDAAGLSHAEWLALLLDHEATYRNDRRLALRLRHAKLRKWLFARSPASRPIDTPASSLTHAQDPRRGKVAAIM